MPNNPEAEVRAAAWSLVAKYGEAEAMRILQRIISEIDDSLWRGPGNR